MKNTWLKSQRNVWEQYVGRRVVKLRRLDRSAYYIAYAGNVLCGVHDTLTAAQQAAERA